MRASHASNAGFTLIEMLVAAALMITITGAVFTVMNPAHGIFQAQPEVADMQQRLRVAVDTLGGDIMLAGAGSYAGRTKGGLVHYFAPVLPYRVGLLGNDSDAGVFYRPDTLSLIYQPGSPAQATVARPLATSATNVEVATATNCPRSTAQTVCGFSEGTRVAVFDALGASDLMTVTGVDDVTMTVRHGGALSSAYDAGATVAAITSRTYYLKSDLAAGTFQLMRYDGYRSDLPVIDNIVSLRFDYFGDPQPPALLPDRPLSGPAGPWTTYGPRPPELDADNPHDSWPVGENCVFTVAGGVHVPRLAVLAAGLAEVTLTAAMLTDGPWCPDAATPGRFDADLLRIRRVHAIVRVQAAAPSLRGPAGRLFTRGGTATTAERYVPDREVSFDITPRNMTAGR